MSKLLTSTNILRSAIILGLLFLFLTGPTLVRPIQAQTWERFDITLGELGYGDHVLSGPSSQVRYYFSLPANWEPQARNYIELELAYEIVGQMDSLPALLTVELNDQILQTHSFETASGFRLLVDIPPDTLRLFEETSLNKLQLSLQVDVDCEQASSASLTVRNSSLLHFRYAERPLLLDLAQYPKPVYQARTFQKNMARFILPAVPSEADLWAATMAAAQLGDLTEEKLTLTTSLLSNLPSTVGQQEHLFIIGQPQDNPLMQQLALPLPISERQLALHSQMPAAIVPGQVFTLGLSIENTSATDRELALQDNWPAGVTLVACQGQCETITSNSFVWNIGQLKAHQEISTNVQLLVDPVSVLPGESVEHTASLLDDAGNVINIDTLSAVVGATSDGQIAASSPEKSQYFFVHDNRGVAENDAIIQEIISPWSDHHVVIVVTGLNDEAILKAGQALGAKTRFPGISGPYAIVKHVQATPQPPTQSTQDMTFASLDYDDQVLDILAHSDAGRYTFQIPRGGIIAPDAALNLHFAHGAALNVVSATLEVELNSVPVYSILLDEHNANDTWHTIPLSENNLSVGYNRLDFQLGGNFHGCMNANLAKGFWLSIYADSVLHLPYEEGEYTFGLADFPQPFSVRCNLENVTFLLPSHPITTEIEGLLNLAMRLGNTAGGDYFSPRVVLGGNPEQADWQERQLIALGRPTTNPFIAYVNDSLPQPFVPGTDEIRQQIDDIIYHLPPDRSLGYAQLLLSPWDKNYVMLVVTGSTDEGVIWSLDALISDSHLAGNLATIVQEGQVRTTDTREPEAKEQTELVAIMTPEATATPTPTPTATPTPVFVPTATMSATSRATTTPTATSSSTPEVVNYQPIWIKLLLIISILTVIVSVGIYIWQSKSQSSSE